MYRIFIIAVVCIISTVRALAADPFPARIVSLVPSATETLYAIGAGDQVVGVTRYCRYPLAAQSKPKVGGIVDASYESILALQPDLCIISHNASDQKAMLMSMGLNFLEIETRSIPEIITSINRVGAHIGRSKEATEITAAIEQKIQEIKTRTRDLKRVRVLVTFLRPMGEGIIREVYIAGNHTYYNDIIDIVGGVNAYQGSQMITSPIVSAEGILQMDPDVIIEVMSKINETNMDAAVVLKDWKMLSELKAYRNHRIHILDQQYMGIPGPRIKSAIEDMARIVHPEVDWERNP